MSAARFLLEFYDRQIPPDEKFKDLRGFEVEYDTIVAGRSHLTVHNMSGFGIIAIADTDADGECRAMLLPKDAALRLALFILSEFPLREPLDQPT